MLIESGFEADRHNFGRSVELTERGAEGLYSKPRSVFWENLFFGMQSPLAPIFRFRSATSYSMFSDYLFNLRVMETGKWSGTSKAILTSNQQISKEHFYSFGVILAYSYAFGIRDLHRYNLVFLNKHLQVIDAEVVLTNLILPNETVLLPFKGVPFELSGISLIADSLDSISRDESHLIVSGFLDLFFHIVTNRELLLSSLEEAIDIAAPIRVILRNTGDYRTHLLGEGISNLLPEEETQLRRNDIPYFYKYMGKDGLMWVKDCGENESLVGDSRDFKSDILRHGVNPEDLLSDSSSLEQKMARGVFYLLKILTVDSNDFTWSSGSMGMRDGKFTNATTGSLYQRKISL